MEGELAFAQGVVTKRRFHKSERTRIQACDVADSEGEDAEAARLRTRATVCRADSVASYISRVSL